MLIPEVKVSAPTPANVFYVIHQFEVARETGSRRLSKCIVGLFWARIFNVGANSSAKTVPQCTLTTSSTWSTAQPQNGEYMVLDTAGKSDVPMISVNLLSFFLVKVMFQSQKGGKI